MSGRANIANLRQRDASSPFAKQLRETLNTIPAHAWYAAPSGALIFQNERAADYAGLPKDHPHRFGIDTGAPWDSHISFLHPDDHDETRRVWSNCLETESAGEVNFRARNALGEYRWYISRAEPLRAPDGTLLFWVGVNLDIEERVQAEKALRKSEEEQQRILDFAPQMIAVLGPNRERLFANRGALDYLGVTLEEYLEGRAAAAGRHEIHPEDMERLEAMWQAAMKSGLPFELEKRMRKSDGSYRWFLARYTALRDDDGRIRRWYVASTDIEELKQAEFYLKEGQRLAHTGSWALDATGFTHWSSQLFEIYGLDPAGKPPSIPEFIALVQPEDRDFVEKAIEKMLSDHRGADLTKRIVRPDGAVRHIRCVGIPVPSGGFLGTAIDVTDQEVLMQATRASEEQLRQILDLTPQIIGVVSPRRERLYANRTALDYFGVSLDEWRTQKPGSDVHPDDQGQLQSKWTRALSEGSAFENEQRVCGKDGTYRWFLVRYNPVRGSDGEVARWHIACTDIEERKRHEEKLQRENAALREEISRSSMFEEIVGSSEPLRKVLGEIDKVARTDSTVLVLGETGTGKELIARAIHKRSKRSTRPFVGVNCGAIPASLITSELFGHEKGAFTGATQRHLGRFEAANGGTIFLDEVGDLPPDIQIALLRVLQEREIERVGGDKPIPVDVRVLAATHRDLDRLVSEGKFRQDLFYRLNVVPLSVPPLRERVADIPALAEYFIARIGKKVGKRFVSIEKKTMKVLQAYGWPGNVREFQNVIERAVTLSDTDTFAVDEAWLKRPVPGADKGVALGGALLAHEKDAIEAALAECHGRISGPGGAGAKLGIPDSTLDSKIKRLGIDKRRFKSR
jgi:PAS domain S-box-containing protein